MAPKAINLKPFCSIGIAAKAGIQWRGSFVLRGMDGK